MTAGKPTGTGKSSGASPSRGTDTSALASALVALGMKYGPTVYEAVKKGQEPARRVAEREVDRAAMRRRALEHAHHLVDGSVLTVFDGDQRLFVVFNGDRPIASHPSTTKSLEVLIQGYDLDKRVRSTPRPRLTPRIKSVLSRPRGVTPRRPTGE
ncbi:hypothetical protein [Arsenicicoccus dermatophilus]|uniref:hypothetical protein n=1 Tax=Arsenicicoccus dermatophilus TaxID=1076331 RepID=UPI00391704B2